MNLPQMTIRNMTSKFPIIQGGMGVGYSNYILASAVAREGGIGVLSSAGASLMVSQRHGRKMKNREAIAQDIRDAKERCNGGLIGMNIMAAVVRTFKTSILGSMDGGADIIISGAGLPITLPLIAKEHPRFEKTALVPIASSARAFELLCRKWQKNSGRLPDAVIVEGPMAGGHLAWREEKEVELPSNKLENLITDVLEVSHKYGDIPVIAAGGVYDKKDIESYLKMGCKGVQMGTRFLATKESGASNDYKEAIVNSRENDIVLAKKPGSPCGLLFRVLKDSPFYQESIMGQRPENCSKGFLLDSQGQCQAKINAKDFFCICNGLLAASNHAPEEKELYTVGELAHRIDRITTVHELMAELTS